MNKVIQKLPVNEEFGKLAPDDQILRTSKALEVNGMTALVVENGEEAKTKVLGMIPEAAEVFTVSSMTLEAIGLDKEINESGKYNAVRPRLYAMDRNTQGREMAKLGATPEWVVGSAHAVTEDEYLLVASNTGSQLAGEVYGAEHVIFVMGTQKVVNDIQEGIKRIYEYSYPLEDERAQKAYGFRSGVGKILIINKENKPGRITVVLVEEKLGF